MPQDSDLKTDFHRASQIRDLDLVEIQFLLRDFYELTGYSSAVIDLSGNVLVKVGWQDVCEIFHRRHPDCLQKCKQSDVEFSGDIPLGQFQLYKCQNQLWDIVTPLNVGDAHVANLFFGQFFFEDTAVDLEYFREQAHKYGFPEKEYLAAVSRVPRYSQDEVAKIMSFFSDLGKLISEKSSTRQLLQKTLDDRDKLLNSLSIQSLALEQIGDAVIITDLDGKITYVNNSECRISGFDRSELLGKNLSIFGRNSEAGSTTKEILEETKKHGSYRGVVETYTKNKKKIFMEVRTALVKDRRGEPIALCGSFTEITDRMETMQKLYFQQEVDRVLQNLASHLLESRASDLEIVSRQSLADLGKLLDLDRVQLFRVDTSANIFFSQSEWCREGVESQDDILRDIPLTMIQNWIKALEEREYLSISCIGDLPEQWIREKEFLRVQGIESVLDIPIKHQGVLTGFLSFDSLNVKRDWEDVEITMAKMAAKLFSVAFERRDYENQLIQARDKAEESNRIKSTFMGIVNHELRTPLNHILGYAQLMEATPNSPDIAEYAAHINSSGKHLLHLLQDIFNLSLNDPAQALLQPTLFKMNDHFEQNQQSLRDILNSSGKRDKIILRFCRDKSISEPEIYADVGKINMILHNLFKNAVSFCDSGEIVFGYELLDDDMIRYFIKDTGIGIPQNMHEKIFDIFSQGQDVYTRKVGGMGLGLPISKRLSEILGGRLYFESIAGEGSTFYLEIPVVINHHPEQGEHASSKPRMSLDLSGKHVMVVDDEHSILMLFKHYLRKSGVIFHQARNGEDALDNLDALPSGSVILMDLQMPVMDGFETTAKIKDMRQDLKIVAVTGYATESDKPALMNSGFDAFVPKPVVKTALFKVLKDLCVGS